MRDRMQRFGRNHGSPGPGPWTPSNSSRRSRWWRVIRAQDRGCPGEDEHPLPLALQAGQQQGDAAADLLGERPVLAEPRQEAPGGLGAQGRRQELPGPAPHPAGNGLAAGTGGSQLEADLPQAVREAIQGIDQGAFQAEADQGHLQ